MIQNIYIYMHIYIYTYIYRYAVFYGNLNDMLFHFLVQGHGIGGR